LNLEDGTNRLSRNVGKKLPLLNPEECSFHFSFVFMDSEHLKLRAHFPLQRLEPLIQRRRSTFQKAEIHVGYHSVVKGSIFAIYN
jgi:hypothetical protein